VRKDEAEAEAVYSAERAHLDRWWPDNGSQDFVWTIGPIGERLPRFRVRRIAPREPVDPWIYVTMGAWEATHPCHPGLEFFLLAPSESMLHVELLAMVANFHADPRYSLSLGQVVYIGRPWIQGAAADHLLVSLPYPYGPVFEWCELEGAGARQIRFLWLVPITAGEARFKAEQGLEALERRFEAGALDMLDPCRPIVA
jgi:hypothetical protein